MLADVESALVLESAASVDAVDTVSVAVAVVADPDVDPPPLDPSSVPPGTRTVDPQAAAAEIKPIPSHRCPIAMTVPRPGVKP